MQPQADLLVLGRDGQNKEFRTGLIGSTVNGVIRKTGKSTLVVPEGAQFGGPIVLAFDGVMVARGDLSVEIPLWEVPAAQKRIIKLANLHDRLVIIATQMLDMFNARAKLPLVRQIKILGADAHDVAVALIKDRRRKEIHRGGSKETGDELIGRVIVKLHWTANLFHPAIAKDDDLVGQRHRFGLIVRDVDHRCTELPVEVGNLDPRIHAQCGIEI